MMMMMMMMFIIYAISAEDIADVRGHRVYLLPAVCYTYLPLVRSMSFSVKTGILVGTYIYILLLYYCEFQNDGDDIPVFFFSFFPYHMRYIIINFNIMSFYYYYYYVLKRKEIRFLI